MQRVFFVALAVCLTIFSKVSVAQGTESLKPNIGISLDNPLDLLVFDDNDANIAIKSPLKPNRPQKPIVNHAQDIFKKYPPHHFAWQVFSEICQLNIREPQIVMRQALLETGQFKASFLMQRNNLFGFRTQRYLTFDNWKESVRYYRDWQLRHHKATDKNYYSFLTRIGYGAPSYSQHVRTISWGHDCSVLNQLKSPQQLVSLQIPLKKSVLTGFEG